MYHQDSIKMLRALYQGKNPFQTFSSLKTKKAEKKQKITVECMTFEKIEKICKSIDHDKGNRISPTLREVTFAQNMVFNFMWLI